MNEEIKKKEINPENSEVQNNIEKMEKKEPSIEEKLKDTEDKLLRSLAEIENQRRRFEKEIKEAFEYGGYNFAKENLAVLDNLQRAYLAIKNDTEFTKNPDLDKFLKNLEILEKDLTTIFEKNKIIKIKTTNEKFDPNLHQAMLEIENDDVEPGTILQDIQPGYMMGDRLLRPSFVGVSKSKKDEIDEKSEKKEV